MTEPIVIRIEVAELNAPELRDVWDRFIQSLAPVECKVEGFWTPEPERWRQGALI